MIERSAIAEFFAMSGPLDGPRRWDFFFCDHVREKLERLVPPLRQLGYEIVSITEPNPRIHPPDLLWLRARRVATHSADTLFSTCEQLDALAKQARVESFDGFDVAD
jgi:hypothetical protein